jgi:protein involved in polysaccharide export with SLBB domain
MRRTFTLCTLLLSLCVSPYARASGDAADPVTPSEKADYILVAGDVVEITVSSHMGYDRTLTIPPDGKIQFPSLGQIEAAGLTTQQLTTRIREGLNKELVDPEVTISLKEINKGLLRRVSVLGAVKTPGVYELKERSSLSEMLAAAGGPSKIADLRRVTITRADSGQRVTIDLTGSARTGTDSNTLPLEAGDLILVPEGTPPTVTVLGEVLKPGSFEFNGEMRLLDALSLAGGTTPAADLQQVTLTHAGETARQSLDIQSLLIQGRTSDSQTNVQLKPGDTIVLTASEQKFYVLGEVNKSQAFPLKPNVRLLDAITTAGGTTKDANLSKIVLIRKDDKGQAVGQQIDFKQMMKKGELEKNAALQAGDVVFVPGKRQKKSLIEALSFLYPLSGLVNVLK